MNRRLYEANELVPANRNTTVQTTKQANTSVATTKPQTTAVQPKTYTPETENLRNVTPQAETTTKPNIDTSQAEDATYTEVNNTTNTADKAKKTRTTTSKSGYGIVYDDIKGVFSDNEIARAIKDRYLPVTKISINAKGQVVLEPKDKPRPVQLADTNTANAVTTKAKESKVLDDSALRVLESLNITLPDYMKMTEDVQATNLNSLFRKDITEYLNSRGIGILSLIKDNASGRLVGTDNKGQSFYVDEIEKYINSTVTQDWEVYDPLTNEDIANIKGQLTTFLKSYKMPLKATKLNLADGINADLKAVFTLGRIIKATLKESMIKKFKEDTTSSTSGKISIEMSPEQYTKYMYGDKTKTKPSMEAEFNCCIFLNKENKTNDYATEAVVPLIQKNLCEELNKKKMKLSYKKDNAELIYNVTFEIGNEQNTRYLKDKNVVVFTLKITKAQAKASKARAIGKGLLNGASKLVNTLATASGAVVQANNASRNSSPVQL